jgi:hypothetical protein
MAKEFSIGRDVSLDVVDPLLGVIKFTIKTGFKSTPQYVDIQSKDLNGLPLHDVIPNGHNLEFDLDRKDGTAEDYFASREAIYFNGGEVPNVSVTETIRERDQSITQYRYTGVSLKLTNAGTWSGNEVTKQALAGFATRKIKIL